MKDEDNDGQMDAYSMFVPTNDVLEPWVSTVLLENYKTLRNVPTRVMADFVNTLLFNSAAWPSQFATKNNVREAPARFTDAATTARHRLRNGSFMGTQKIK